MVTESKKMALLVMDVQVSVVDRVLGADSDALIAKANQAVHAARVAGIAVIYVQIAFREGYPEVSPANRIFSQLAKSHAFSASDPASRIDPRIAPAETDVVVTKPRHGAFFASDLEVILRSTGVRSLVLCGIATSGVVLSTVREAYDRDFELIVLEDACVDRDPDVHEFLMKRVLPQQADVMTVTEWIRQVARKAR
jgi:nicotinamidase-related amidase